MLRGIVNPGILLSPLTTREAVLSSRIEGTYATVGEVFEYEADPTEPIEAAKSADIQEIINYRQAMAQAVQKLKERPLCLNLIRELHTVLLSGVRGEDKAPGEFRRVQNFIGSREAGIEKAIFVPPSVDHLASALGNWEEYLHFQEKDPLVQLALAKAQFELIHPFLDGNGRIGRMLVPIFLFEKMVLSSPVFYLSSYLEENRDAYYQRLRAISSDGDWNGWIAFFLNAIIEQSRINTDKTHSVLALYDRMKRDVPAITHSQYAIQAIDAIFQRPIFQSTDFIRQSDIPKASALRILDALRSRSILEEIRPGSGRRATLYAFWDLVRIAD